MIRIFLSLVTFVTLLTLMSVPVQSTVLATPRLQTQAPPATETFVGTILKNGENFVLSDSATKTRYALDNQKLARTFGGKTVKVTGTLERGSNLIHVQAIQEIV